MFPKEDIKTYDLESKNLKVSILESGNIKEIRDGIVRINTYVGNNFEPTVSNIYMRTNNGFSRLIGIGSNSEFKVIKDNDSSFVIYKGVFDDVHYHIIFKTKENALLFNVKLEKNPEKVVELYYGLDVSINNIYAISNNEAYVSQYIDHKVYKNDYGYVICSRQNSDVNYYLESGSIGNNVSYSVDGFQFFGKDYKETNVPVALLNKHLDNKIYQYEFAYHALKTDLIKLDSNKEITFYSVYNNNHPEKITKPLYNDFVKGLIDFNTDYNDLDFKKLDLNFSYDDVITSKSFTEKEIKELYSNRFLEEKKNGKIYSFFSSDKSHVLVKEKELLLERPSGNIIISQNKFNNQEYDFENVIGNTSYIYGLFMSQVVCGNTTFNKLLTNQRNPLNIQKISGLRIFIKHNGNYKLLTMPGIFQMGLNYFKWLYKIDDDVLEFIVFVSLPKSKLELSFNSKLGRKYEFLVTNNFVMGEREHESKVHVSQDDKIIKVLFDEKSMTYNKYPDLYFKYLIDCDYEYSDDRLFFKDNLSRNENLLTLKLNENKFNICICTSHCDDNHLDFSVNKNYYLNKMEEFVNYFHIEGIEELESYNYLVYWYTHDAMIHYLSPHGLEQYNGAAWGTRDVCQGPAELFMSFNKNEYVRKIILDVYNHQFLEDGDFPQWFMFDKFYNILDLSSHGDIIVWPIRLLALYLEKTLDFSIFSSEVPFIKRDGIVFSPNYSIMEHVIKELNLIKSNFIKGTYLSCYGGGDWDDTLQPAHKEYKSSMVSGWTTELTYEAFVRLGNVLKGKYDNLSKELLELANNIKIDYHKYLIKDGVASGFIRFTDEGIKYICHPSDKESGIKFRLLPQTRGIISGMFSEEEIKTAIKIMDDYLTFPDGVRLMDTTVKYDGGVKKFFNRAETAANFGREIGLQYSHANVRYCEAMAKVRDGNRLFLGLQKINPIVINDLLDNACLRQRNSYFSSSDAAFLSRIEAMKHFDDIKNKKVKVKGGWRVYSSGPGIFIRTFVCDMLGINEYPGYAIIDPVIPHYFNDFKFNFMLFNHKVTINYHLNKEKKKILIDGKENGIVLDKGFKIDQGLIKDNSIIDIYLENELINNEIKGCFDFFWNETKANGLTIDKIYSNKKSKYSSIASIGFALASYVIGVERGYISFSEGMNRVRTTLDTILKIEDFHGLLPHFLNFKTDMNDSSEYSTIDTSILLMGAISAASYFGNRLNIYDDVKGLVNRVDWDYFVREVDGRKLINMAYSKKYWKEFDGFCPACWDHYAEQLMIYFLYACKDDTTKADSLDLYHGFTRHKGSYKGDEFIHCYSNPLFIHQFTHSFIDFRNIKTDDGIDWFKNSVDATLANRRYCINQKWSKTYNENSWGLSAFEGKNGYKVFGAKPFGFPDKECKMELDGSVTPYASLASICFTPKYSLKALDYFNSIEGLNGKYGLTDSYNFDDYYISDCYIGIDKGPTIIMLDNYQNGTIWRYFMNCEMTKKALEKLSFINK